LSSAEEKQVRLNEILKEMGSVLIAFSGGVDSTFLASAAFDSLGQKALAVFGKSEVSPPGEIEEAERLAALIKIRFMVVETHEMQDPRFTANPPERCYYCKQGLFEKLKSIAGNEKLEWIADGSNRDDLSDFRPGMKACREAGVRSPLQEAGLTKQEIRQLSRQRGLPTWNKAASPCLASRIPYGTPVSGELLQKIAEGEKYLHSLGVGNLRLRHHGDIARIEVDEPGFSVMLDREIRLKTVEKLKELGYRYVTLDLAGYRTGSLNAGIDVSAYQGEQWQG